MSPKRNRQRREDRRVYRGMIERARRSLQLQRAAKQAPTYTHPCFGRETELEQLQHWFQRSYARLMTLTGESGIGKTHLANEFAKRCEPLGIPIAYLNLTLVQQSSQIVPELFHALEVSFPGQGVWQWAVAQIFKAPALLVLDDMHHLLPEGAQVVQQLLEAAPALRILVTSQLVLGLEGEEVLALQPLPTPDSTVRSLDALRANPCVALLTQYAGDYLPLTPRNALQIRQLCIEQGGHPGRIVEVATLLRSCPPHEFPYRYRAWQQARCTTDARAPEQGAYQLYLSLREEERRQLRCLSVFVGDFTVAAASAVAHKAEPATRQFLQMLQQRRFVDLVQTQPEPHYRLAEPMRRLNLVAGLTPEHQRVLARRLQHYYCEWLRQLVQCKEPAEQIRRLCYAQSDTLRRTLEWLAQAGEVQSLIALLEQLVEACAHRPPAAVLDWGVGYASRASALSDAERVALAKPLMLGLIYSGLNEQAHELAEWLRDSPEFAFQLGRYWHNLADGDNARRYYSMAWFQADSQGDRELAVRAAVSLAESEAVIGNLKAARELLSQVRMRYPLARLSHEARGWLYYVEAYVCYQQGLFRRSWELYHTSSYHLGTTPEILREISRIELEFGRYDAAIHAATRALNCHLNEVEPHQPAIHALYGCLGDAYALKGQYDLAFDYHSRALAFWRTLGQPRWICWSLNRLAEIELLARDAGHPWRIETHGSPNAETLLQEAWAVIEPTYMNLLYRARTLHNQGWLAWHQQRLDEAEHYLAQALEIREGCGATYGAMRTREILARVRFSQGRHEEAKTLFEQARRVREQLRAVQYPQLKRCNLSIRRRLRA